MRVALVLLCTPLCTLALGGPVAAQEPAVDPAGSGTPVSLSRTKLSGPRFGFTTFTGEVADLRDRAGKEAIMTQFGWQFETRIASPSNGSQALMEWVFLVGGVEQDELNLSLSWLAGYRMPNGFELGAGPAISANKDSDDVTTSMVLAGGATAPLGDLYLPIHLAVALSRGGPRITTLIGWVVG
jgi:hypothetical protein